MPEVDALHKPVTVAALLNKVGEIIES